MGREVRKVPANWEHPKKDNGTYQPMFETYYGDAFNDWLINHNKWLDESHDDLKERPELKDKYPFYAMWGGNPPDVEYYQAKKFSHDELTHIQMYEDTSEGTPISPVFDNAEEMAHWLADNNASAFGNMTATYEQWLSTINIGFATSAIIQDGKIKSGVEASNNL